MKKNSTPATQLPIYELVIEKYPQLERTKDARHFCKEILELNTAIDGISIRDFVKVVMVANGGKWLTDIPEDFRVDQLPIYERAVNQYEEMKRIRNPMRFCYRLMEKPKVPTITEREYRGIAKVAAGFVWAEE